MSKRDTERDVASRGTHEEKDKKERVLHTRVPISLDQELKRLAETVRVPVSNLVRSMLEDAVAMADRASRGIEEELSQVAHTLRKGREGILERKTSFLRDSKSGQAADVERQDERQVEPIERQSVSDLVGFQPLTLAAQRRCDLCDAQIDKGDTAWLATHMNPATPRLLVCTTCGPAPNKTD